ncbi:MAG: hypothetical protein IPL23_00270 [Saprospiraceae bacterium]|nr:hypothetical protein [Saprospiraceae bacterium]
MGVNPLHSVVRNVLAMLSNGQCLQRNGQACGAMSCERNEFNVSSMPAAQFPAGAIFLHSVSTQ